MIEVPLYVQGLLDSGTEVARNRGGAAPLRRSCAPSPRHGPAVGPQGGMCLECRVHVQTVVSSVAQTQLLRISTAINTLPFFPKQVYSNVYAPIHLVQFLHFVLISSFPHHSWSYPSLSRIPGVEPDLGFRISDLGRGVSGFIFWVSGLGFRGSRFRISCFV